MNNETFSAISAMAENNKRIAELLTQALGHLSSRHGKISEAKALNRQALELNRQALELLQEEAKPL